MFVKVKKGTLLTHAQQRGVAVDGDTRKHLLDKLLRQFLQ